MWTFYLSVWTCHQKAPFLSPQKSMHSQRWLPAGWGTLKTDSELLVSLVATSSPCVVCRMLQQIASNHSFWFCRGSWPCWNCGCPETMLCHHYSRVFLHPQCPRPPLGPGFGEEQLDWLYPWHLFWFQTHSSASLSSWPGSKTADWGP